MRTITFYSFKGGVGRTMALVNVAAELAKRGRKVLVVDFDLEAPGLETYKQLSPKKAHPGIVEYVSKFIDSRQIPEIRDYIYEPEAMKEYKGKLSVMPAGRRDGTYRQQLIKLDWRRFYLEGDGFRFFEETKAYWSELGFDYVLIDSRTGDTDVLGICTRQLPDSVVILFVPNEQNRAGLVHVCRDIRREFEGLPTKTLHFVAANVPNLDDEDDFLRDQIKMFKKDLEFRRLSAVIRRYESLELLDQSVVVLDRPRSRLAKSYQRLAATLMKENYLADRDGALFVLNDEVQQSLPKLEYDTRSAMALRLNLYDQPTLDTVRTDSQPDESDQLPKRQDRLNQIAGQFLDDTEILNNVANCWIQRGQIRSAIKALDRSLNVNPKQEYALRWRGHCKRYLNHLDEAADDLLRFMALVPSSPENQATVMGDIQYAFYELREIAPNRLIEAAEALSPYHLDDATVEHNADAFAETEEGIPAAAKLLRDHFQKSPPEAKDYELWLMNLAKARCWKEITDLFEKHGAANFDCQFDWFFVAIAYWAQTRKMPPQICRSGLEALGGESENWRRIRIWLLWGAGQVSEALKLLEEFESSVRESPDESAISPWWFGSDVPVKQALEDCQKIRRLMQGEPLRPAFLGPALK